MAEDTPGTLSIVDGTVAPQKLQVGLDALNSLAYQVLLRVRGLIVSDTNPLPVRGPSLASVYSAVAETRHILKAAAGTLYALQANPSASGYVMLFDLASPPADGVVAPRKCWFYSASDQKTLDMTFDPPLALTNGAVVCFSSTGPFVLTTGPTAQFSAEIV